MKYTQYLLAILIMVISTASFALNLQSAKDQGLVGETPSGYLASPKGSSSADVKSLMANINAKRKQKYAEVAAKVGKPLGVIERLAGKKATEKTSTGRFVQLANKRWKTK
jgi:uncharacterized protein YdbL (DUF1318 family)